MSMSVKKFFDKGLLGLRGDEEKNILKGFNDAVMSAREADTAPELFFMRHAMLALAGLLANTKTVTKDMPDSPDHTDSAVLFYVIESALDMLAGREVQGLKVSHQILDAKQSGDEEPAEPLQATAIQNVIAQHLERLTESQHQLISQGLNDLANKARKAGLPPQSYFSRAATLSMAAAMTAPPGLQKETGCTTSVYKAAIVDMLVPLAHDAMADVFAAPEQGDKLH